MRPEGWKGSSPRLRAAMPHGRARRRLLLLAVVGLVLLLVSVARLRSLRQAPAAAATADGEKPAAPPGVNWRHSLFQRIAEDLPQFNLIGITHQMVEQAYCQGTRASMRVQVRGRDRRQERDSSC